MATASGSGLVTGTGEGNAIITATQAGVSGTTTVTVTPAVLTSITVTPADSSIAKGTSKQLTATGTFSDGTTKDLTMSVAWTSSDPTLAPVSNATGNQGLVTGSAAGTATITATQAGISGTAMVTVTPPVLTSIAVTPADQTIPNGGTIQLIATGTFSDGTTQDLTHSVSWTSPPGTIVTVGNTVDPGLATAIGVGTAAITATQAGVSGTTTLTVGPTCGTGDGPTIAAYNAIPSEAVNCSPASESFEGDATSEIGDEVGLAPGTGRTLVSLKVVFVSYGCGVSGHWYDGSCVTSSGATTFDHPITANIYDCSGAQCPGALLATVTQTQTIPYRPSADPTNCPTSQAKWFNPFNITSPGGKCEGGISTVLTFTFSTPVTLPDQVLWTVAFNTTHYGPMPIGEGAACSSSASGCAYDSLNVGDETYANAPYAGTDIDPNGVFINSANPVNYCGLPSGALGPATPCWTTFTPLGEIITKP
jgi:uncharacterized protein YjdB